MVATRRTSEEGAEFPCWPPRRSRPTNALGGVRGQFEELVALAAERGQRWAELTFTQCPYDRARPWPERGAEIHRIARSWCANLTSDESELLILAGIAVRSAAAYWNRLRRS